MTRWPD